MVTLLDEAIIEIASGRGGNGSVSFRREKFVPHGGPNGGDGGRGGDVIIVADTSLNTLLDYKYQTSYKADNGGEGMGGGKNGKDADPLRLRVPVGTTIFDAESKEMLADLIHPDQEWRALKGGSGGFGNEHFKSSSRQTPRFAQRGEPSQKIKLLLSLKLIADVGVIGYPNAGKSSLISMVSAAKPKIADYPFTTLVPNLGVVRAGDSTFVMADMPGLIEGAHEGIGLGIQFLKHIERTRLLLHIIDVSPLAQLEPLDAYRNINKELELYGSQLLDKPMIVGLNKIDTLTDRSGLDEVKAKLIEEGKQVFLISAVTGEGVEGLLYAIAETLKTIPVDYSTDIPLAVVNNPRRMPKDWEVRIDEENIYIVEGKSIERMVAMADTRQEEGLLYLHRRLVKAGVIEALKEAGCVEGKTVRIRDLEFEFVEDE